MNATELSLVERRQGKRRIYEWEPSLFQGIPPILPIQRRGPRRAAIPLAPASSPSRILHPQRIIASSSRLWTTAGLLSALIVGVFAGSAAKPNRRPETIVLVRQRVAPSQAIYQWEGFHRIAPAPLTH